VKGAVGAEVPDGRLVKAERLGSWMKAHDRDVARLVARDNAASTAVYRALIFCCGVDLDGEALLPDDTVLQTVIVERGAAGMDRYIHCSTQLPIDMQCGRSTYSLCDIHIEHASTTAIGKPDETGNSLHRRCA
jgi:hypothetical protein